MAKEYCPICEVKMEKRTNKITKKAADGTVTDVEDTVLVCPTCKGVFIPESIFGIH